MGIERVHLEEDTGKNTHVGTSGRIHGADYSLVDYNRAGIPLVEIVTKPVPGTGALAPEVAKAYVTELRDILRTLGVSDVRMEQGSLRCDVNTSLNRPGAEWGTRTETKNVNSLRSVERAVRSEILRQAALLDAGERIMQETRHFSETTGDTRPGRSKEEATDYRYFPEPDLVPIAPDPEWVESLRAGLPELPAARRRRLVRRARRQRRGHGADDQRRRGRPRRRDESTPARRSARRATGGWAISRRRRTSPRSTPAELAIRPSRSRG